MSDTHQPKIITARRAYEFGPDELRLTMVTMKPIQETIQKAFGFQNTAIGSPLQTFGPVISAIPQGMVFDTGFVSEGPDSVTPIRFLHFEPTRIVIDVAGPSTSIDAIYMHLRTLFAELTAPDGSAVLGNVTRILDYSVITINLPFPPEEFIDPRFRHVLGNMFDTRGLPDGVVTVPLIRLAVTTPFASLPTTATGDEMSFGLEIRVGTPLTDRTYFSVATLDTQTHFAKLNEMVAAFG